MFLTLASGERLDTVQLLTSSDAVRHQRPAVQLQAAVQNLLWRRHRRQPPTVSLHQWISKQVSLIADRKKSDY